MMLARWFLVLASSGHFLQGCTTGCLDVCATAVRLLVIDATNRQPLCDAEVVVNQGGTVPADHAADAGLALPCKFLVGCGAGTYQFRISRPGYRTETTTVV